MKTKLEDFLKNQIKEEAEYPLNESRLRIKLSKLREKRKKLKKEMLKNKQEINDVKYKLWLSQGASAGE